MRPSPAAVFNAELGELSAVHFNTALAAAAAEDAARNDNRDTRERAVTNHGRDHYRHEDDIPLALQRMMTSSLPRQVLAKVKRALRRDMRKPSDVKVRLHYLIKPRVSQQEIQAEPRQQEQMHP